MTRRERNLNLAIGAGIVGLLGGALALALTSGAATTPKTPQTIVFVSTPPVPAYVGDTYEVVVYGGNSGNPITLTNGGVHCTIGTVTQAPVFTSTPPSPALVGGTYNVSASPGARAIVTFTHKGTCNVTAKQAATSAFSAGSTTLSTAVVPVPTSG
jgi:hypothetical protein